MKLFRLLVIISVWILSPTTGFCGIGPQGSVSEEALFHKLEGDRHLNQGNAFLAIQEYEKAIALNPSSTATHFNLAIAYYSKRDTTKAIAALEHVVQLNPEDVEAHYNLACLRLYEQNLEKAQLHFERANLCCDPNSKFAPLITHGLEFIEEFQKADSSDQNLFFYFVQEGLPSIILNV